MLKKKATYTDERILNYNTDLWEPAVWNYQHEESGLFYTYLLY